MSPDNLKGFLPVLHKDLELCGIEYAICGAVAMWPYNIDRFTRDIDIVVSKVTALRLKSLMELGYQWSEEFPRTLRYQTGGVPIEIDVLIEGFNLDSEGLLRTPNPVHSRVRINGVWFLRRDTLILMKELSDREQDQLDAKRLKELDDERQL